MWSRTLILSAILGLGGSSCSSAPDGMAVYRQRVQGSSTVVYRVQAYYGSIGGSFDRGLVIADSSEPFAYSRDDIVRYYALTRVDSREVRVASWLDPNDPLRRDSAVTRSFSPARVERRQVGGVELVTDLYATQVTGSAPGSCGLRRYSFAKLSESADSLVLHGVTHDFGPPLPEDVQFRKGAVTAELDGQGHVEKLTIEELVAGVVPGYEPFQRTAPVPVRTVCVATYEFVHTGPVSQEVSDYGVFKPFSTCSGDC